MVLTNEELPAEWKRACLLSVTGAHFREVPTSMGDIKTEAAAWGKIREESESEIAKKPCLKNVYDGFTRKHVSLDSAVVDRLAKEVRNGVVNHGEIWERFPGIFVENSDIKAEIIYDPRAASHVPNRSYVETSLNSGGFHSIGACFLGDYVSTEEMETEVKDGYFHQEFYGDEEATAFGCQLYGAEISQDSSIKLVQADHGSTNSTQLPSPPFNHKASAPPGNVRDGDGQPVHYINDGASSSQAKCCQLNFSSSANRFLPTAGKLIQPADQGSTNSTQLASPSWNNTATAACGNIRGGNGKSLCYIDDGASSSQSRRASRQNQLNPSSSANIFTPTGGQLIQSDGQDSTNSTQVASSPLSITVCAANGTGRASASSGDIEDGTRQARRHTNGRVASSLVRPANGQNKNRLPTLSKIFIPVAFALLVASSSIWYSVSSTSFSARGRILLILAEVFGFSGLLLCLGGYFSPSGSNYARWLTVGGCVTILCGYISIMCTQLL